VSFESWVDAQIREARERGEFDNLAGAGKPLTDLDGNHDEMWWIRQWLKREDLSFTPPAIALRKAVEDMLANVGKLLTERAVRNVVEELNVRIREMNRIPPLEGPPSNLMPLDVEAVLTRWRAERAVIEATEALHADSGTTPAQSPHEVEPAAKTGLDNPTVVLAFAILSVFEIAALELLFRGHVIVHVLSVITAITVAIALRKANRRA
jgi:hypothetical protein